MFNNRLGTSWHVSTTIFYLCKPRYYHKYYPFTSLPANTIAILDYPYHKWWPSLDNLISPVSNELNYHTWLFWSTQTKLITVTTIITIGQSYQFSQQWAGLSHLIILIHPDHLYQYWLSLPVMVFLIVLVFLTNRFQSDLSEDTLLDDYWTMSAPQKADGLICPDIVISSHIC